MPVGSESFRDALRHFPSGVTIVAVRSGEEVHGLTVSGFTSIAPSPPLVAVLIDHRHRAWELFERQDAVFSVSILGEDQRRLSDRFAWVKDEDRFDEGTWKRAVTGAPVLEDALAWLDCSLHARVEAGDHTVYIGQVEACEVPRPDAPPLVYWNRGYRRLDLR